MGKKANNRKRIGLLLTVGKCEAKKEELVSLRKRIPARPWIKRVDPQHKIRRPVYNARPATVGIPTDVSVGEYISHFHGDEFEIDYIHPKDISEERLARNDVNYLLIYDLLEAFHTDRTRDKRTFKNLKSVIQKAQNVFPSFEFQQFVNSKLLYYNYFQEKGVPICPTITVSKEDFQRECEQTPGGDDDVAKKIFDKIASQGWKKFICKPVYGQESKDCKTFQDRELQKPERFVKHVKSCMAKYPGLIFQKFVEGFGNTKESPELRMYFIGKEYQFTVVATKKKIYTLKGEGGTLKLPESVDTAVMREIATKVIETMPPIKLHNRSGGEVNLPLLLTRVDMGAIMDGVFNPWVNEVEFVPSLYVEDHQFPIDGRIGKEMIAITDQFLGLKPREEAMDIDEPGSPTKVEVQVDQQEDVESGAKIALLAGTPRGKK